MHDLENGADRKEGAGEYGDAARVTHRQRLALGICAAPSLAMLTADRLMATGIAANDIAFGAEAGDAYEALARLVDATPEPHPSVFVTKGREVAPAPLVNAAGVAFSGTAMPLLALANLGHFLTPDLATAVARHLMRGAVIVAVFMWSPESERNVSDILLRSSIDRVQLHDIA